MKLNFSKDALEGARNSRLALINRLKELNVKGTQEGVLLLEYIDRFKECLNDSLNISKGLALINELIRSSENPQDIVYTVLDFDRVLGFKLKESLEGVSIPNSVLDLAKRRVEARKVLDFALADSLRDQIMNMGYRVVDTQEGFNIEKI